ncbi:MAG: aldehyde dehydrogenase family protein [bacterium]|nr:aldehyde dehydrogenase family protein [bacterium]
MKILRSTNPAKAYSFIGEAEISSSEEIIQKVKLANSVKKKWGETDLQKRLEIMSHLLELIKTKKKEITTIFTKEMGKPITESEGEFDGSIFYFQSYLDRAESLLSAKTTELNDDSSTHVTYLEPLGTAAVILPWNFPFLLFVWEVIPNLIVGNTVVLKHSEECPLFSKIMEDIMDQSLLPKNVFSAIYGAGSEGDILTDQDIDIITFTGSYNVGKHLYKKASDKFIPILLELGGSGPGIIFKDADLDNAIEGISAWRYSNNGQICCALKRLIIHKDIAEEFVEKLRNYLNTKKVGDSEEYDTFFGPLVSEKQLCNLKKQVNDARAKGANIIECCNSKIPEGAYYPPTIITDISFDMDVWKTEVFGPVLPVVTFETEEEAVKLANDTEFGLGSYLFTSDSEKAVRIGKQIQAGNVAVNNTGFLNPYVFYPTQKHSGMGKTAGSDIFKELCKVKVISSH